VLVIVVLVGWPSSVYLFHQVRHQPLGATERIQMSGCFSVAVLISLAVWWMGMKSGVRALSEMS